MERDIFRQMEFKPIVADDVKIMDARLFTGEPLGIRGRWEEC
jgi:acyl CoA:acetate/3-ketoacid CoA transferase